jgi:hypothetical protein
MPAASADSPSALATVDLSTGSARVTFAFRLAATRGDAQPSLSLRYDSSAGQGYAGVAWSLNPPSIVRRRAAGPPQFLCTTIFSSDNLALSDPTQT